TEFSEKNNLQKSIQWQSKQKISDIWDYFDQIAYKKTDEPKIMCRCCQAVLVYPSHHRAEISPMKIYMKSIIYAKSSGSKKQNIDQLLQNIISSLFEQSTFQQKILEFITTARLPFRITEYISFKNKYRISIVFDCWISLFKQIFIAITNYFIDQGWNYYKILLGFEYLYRSYTDSNLSSTVIQILQYHKVADQVLSITTDNATNNNTIINSIQKTVQSLLQSGISIFRVLCITHIIQLCFQELLGKLKTVSENDKAESKWSNKQNLDL
ncbi:hypothetical protein N7450_007205, partial [Penicillium hetheringtonii]